MYRLKVLLFFCWGFVLSSAEGQPQAPDTIRLKEVEIISKRSALLSFSSLPFQQASKLQFQTSGGHSVADALKSFAGVTLKDYGGLGGLKTVSMRSLSAHHTAVFIDGLFINDLATGQVDLGKIPLVFLKNLQMGQYYDTLATASMLAANNCIQLVRLNSDVEHKRPEFSASLTLGSFGLVHSCFMVDGLIAKRTHIQGLAVGRTAHGGFPYQITNAAGQPESSTRKNADLTDLNLGLFVHQQISNTKSLQARISGFGSERGLPGALILYNPYSSQRLRNREVSADLRYRQQGSVNSSVQVSVSESYLHYIDRNFPNTAGKLETTLTQRMFYGSGTLHKKAGQYLSFTAGTDWIVNQLHSSQYISDPMRVTWLAMASSSYSKDRLQATGILISTFAFDRNKTGEGSVINNKINYNISMLCKIKPALSARVMLRSIYRLPTFNELYYSLVGNQSLRPEYGTQANAGLSLQKRSRKIAMELTGDIFHNVLRNKIVSVPTQQLFIWSTRNIGKVQTLGIEAQAKISMIITSQTLLNFSGTYTLQKASDRTVKGSTTYGHQIAYVPYEIAAADWTLHHKKISINYSFIFNGFRYFLDQNIAANLLPAWWQHDLTIRCALLIPKPEIALKANISNLFDKRYEVVRSFPMPGRAFNITLDMKF